MAMTYCVCPPCSGKVYGQPPKFMTTQGCCPMSCPAGLPPESPPLEPKCFRRNILGNWVYKWGKPGTCCPSCGVMDRPAWCASTRTKVCYRQPIGCCSGPTKYVK